MKNFINIVFIGIIFTILLFLFLVYPGTGMLANIPTIFQYTLNLIVFVAFIAYLIYLLVEIKSIGNQLIEEDNETSANAGVECQPDPILLDEHIDAQEKYNQLTHHLLTLMELALSANSTFLYLYN